MKKLICWLCGHDLRSEKEIATGGRWFWHCVCSRCGAVDPDESWWWHAKRRAWRWYLWLFVPCPCCERFSWQKHTKECEDEVPF